MAVQKKQSVIPPSQGPLSTRTIESQKKGNGFERAGENGSYIKPNSQAKKAACPVHKPAQIFNTVTPRATAVANGLNVDERLKAARERREEHQKLLASRELSRLEREQRARRYYERQLQERKKKLLEQRLKEERRRAAVEEKRKQRLKEEKERYESAVRRTLEKSQRLAKNGKWTLIFPRRLPLTTWEKNLVSRLLTPTCSYLARSKSAGCQSGEEGTLPHDNRMYSFALILILWTPRRSISRHSTPLQLELPSVPEEDVAVCSSALTPGNSRPARTSAEGQQEKIRDKKNAPETPCLNLPNTETEAITRTAGDGSPSHVPPRPAPQPPEVVSRPSAGTTDPEEASRNLAEKRREARLQREREEQERLQKEEAERRSREELERRRSEERARQQAEAQRLIEEKRRREEEEQRRAEEERAQAMREAALLQKQVGKEEQARERAKAEQMKKEREILAQKEEAERQARKKRLEEIMRRTRRTDSPDTVRFTKSVPARILPNEAQPKENTQPVNNGTIEDVVKLPVGTKSSQLGLNNEEDMVPVVAFKERRSLRTLTGLEEIQTHQRAEVI
uniref:Microtubule-associated protein 7a n=1 Tax=Lates calcarifer TaxID=8187 RepID=A0A4W6EW69_LATCA